MQKILMPTFALYLGVSACGGYKAADPDDLAPRAGEIVGVLVDDRGKASPDATIQLFAEDGEEAISSNQGMDSDGRFGVFPPDSGTYSIVGSFGEPKTSTMMVIAQGIVFTAGQGMNIGKLTASKPGLVSAKVSVPQGVSKKDVVLSVLGFEASASSIAEGIAAITLPIPAGTYTLKLSRSDLKTKLVPNVTVASESIKVEEVTMELAGQ